ncbi:MAG: hypothetical protein IJO90_04180 [Alistipes sp.]|nr:hypothetical protein [Alistipes sp.]MBQ9962547.1 hypothetical protein [Alistipes sp.]
MKKLFVMLVVMLGFTTQLYAQNEVRGVETKVAKYQGSYYSVGDTESNEWFGYSFTNMNSIPVSVDAELYVGSGSLEETKSFILQPQESYIWKFEKNTDFQVTDAYYSGYRTYYYERTEPRLNGSGTKYIIKYKAYKLE